MTTTLIVVTAASQAATFTCGTDGTLSPLNLEKTFKGESCQTEEQLQEMFEQGELVESGMTGSSPIYTLSVNEMPKSGTSLCYKCTYSKQPHVPMPENNDCKVIVKVSAALPATSTSTSEPKAAAATKIESHLLGVMLLGLAAQKFFQTL
ncbi:SAG-related sequence [Besnoitia besnoiti]|uniref:SAG-related sequence n=1 Tax=Besnoitia besnoiti TaxID=94643 RepID=A0A2A9MKZ4_BESBE|nr:SAG-related sequence [Besnoitia besnoiti]PFH36971.1 SAG-related sequence [Besnoitia besnoiti]